MKAAVYTKYGPPEVLQYSDVLKPIITDKEILVKIHASACTKGDCELRSPEMPLFVWLIVRILIFGLLKPRKQILGSYFAGEVMAVGDQVSTFSKGDRIFGISPKFATHAEYITLPGNVVSITMPSNMSYEEAAPLALATDSYFFLKKSRLKSGESILINGAGGGIGSYAIQLAKSYGAEVSAVDSADKLSFMQKNGAEHVFDYTQEDFYQNLGSYDVIMDVIGTIPYKKSMSLLNKHGRYISAIPTVPGLFQGIYTLITSTKRLMSGLSFDDANVLAHLKEAVEAGTLKTFIDTCFPLEQIIDAHRYVESNVKRGHVIIQCIPADGKKKVAAE